MNCEHKMLMEIRIGNQNIGWKCLDCGQVFKKKPRKKSKNKS